jgi:hypothetical protein
MIYIIDNESRMEISMAGLLSREPHSNCKNAGLKIQRFFILIKGIIYIVTLFT